jgi:hypothetical protein
MNFLFASDIDAERIGPPQQVIQNACVECGGIYFWTAPAGEMKWLRSVAMTLGIKMTRNAHDDGEPSYGSFGRLRIQINTRVAYVSARPGRSFERHIAAMMAHGSMTAEQREYFLTVTGAVNLRDPDAVTHLIDGLVVRGARFTQGRKGFGVLFLDNLDLCNPDSDGVTNMGPIIAALQHIAHELACALIVLAVQNPKIDNRPAPVGSSRITVEATGLALLTRDGDALTLTFADSDVKGLFRRDTYSMKVRGIDSTFAVVEDDADRVLVPSTDTKKRDEVEERLRGAARRFSGPLPKLTRLFSEAGLKPKEHAFARKVVNAAVKRGDWITRSGNKFVLVA